jgi:hypothetical protein
MKKAEKHGALGDLRPMSEAGLGHEGEDAVLGVVPNTGMRIEPPTAGAVAVLSRSSEKP